MSRPDLLALTPQALAALSNVGLVKRAQKELEQGKGPRVEELPDGTVVGTFEDGVTARLLPGRGIKDSPCSCNATLPCRHRLATALAYGAFHASAAPPASAPEPPWSPAEVEDAELERALPPRVMERARATRARGFLARVRRAGPDTAVPQVALATCTVSFQAPRNLGLARCDCPDSPRCEHLPLAVWAFRAADAKDATGQEVSVEVARERVDDTPGGAALDTAEALGRHLLLEGAQHTSQGLTARFAVARAGLEEAGLAWPLTALDDVEALLGAYLNRSARYTATHLATVLTELFARPRAARRQTHVPPRAVLGLDEASETRLGRIDLLSLGARLFAEGRERRVEVIFADASARGLLVLRRDFAPPRDDEAPRDGHQLGGHQAIAGTPLEMLARGVVVSEGARRLPNRLVEFATRGTLKGHSVLPQSGDWSRLPAPLLVQDVRALEETWRGRPPRFLRPRQLAENVHAFALSRVVDVTYVPGAQEVHADVEDAAGTAFRVELAHRGVAPGALDALVEALTGARGAPRYVSGEARRTARGLVVEPLAVVCADAGVLVLDLQPPRKAQASRISSTPPPLPPLQAVLAEGEACLADAVHQGLRHVPPGWTARLRAVALRARALGMKLLGEDLEALAARLGEARASGSLAQEAALTRAWVEASLGVHVAQERLGA
ncbi:hypothetical protein [Melittangium boletus]|uniref:hypothetical protein n=1 Tax=Melittangium boletus TaxID=83453 RepID=UPI003DA37309